MWLYAVATAMATQALVVPRLSVRVQAGDPPPDFIRLGRPLPVLLAGALAAVAALIATSTATTHWSLLVFAAFSPLAVVDLFTTYLPNQLMYPLWAVLAVSLSAQATQQPKALIWSALGAVIGYGGFWLVWRFGNSLGYGDVRLAGAIGALTGGFGPAAVLYAFFVGTLIGAIAAVASALAGRKELPYGPWLWLGALAPFLLRF